MHPKWSGTQADPALAFVLPDVTRELATLLARAGFDRIVRMPRAVDTALFDPRDLVAEGRLGKKSGRGFYDWE